MHTARPLQAARPGAKPFFHASRLLLHLFPLVCLLALLVLAACGDSNNATTSSGPTISMLDNVFNPKELYIKAGQTVTWINNGQAPHTITADDHSFDSGDIQPGGSFRHTFTKPGVYSYYCTLHGASGGMGMAGVIEVSASSSVGSTGGSSDTDAATPHHPSAVLRVPADYPTITAAVKAAQSGDLILIAPGIYHEALVIRTPNLTIRGQDRNAVILDGNYTLPNAFQVFANNVILENMTARHYKLNGFYWTGVTGYRGSYLNAYANGDYGIYAYLSVTGQFDHDYAAGQPDSGFYIGACNPCHAIITDVLSEDNALGYSGTNAGGDLVIKNSIWRSNVSGIVPNTLDSEPLAPQSGVTIVHNLVENNNNYNAPAHMYQLSSIGQGIILAGGNNNLVEDNRVSGHDYYGILVVPNIDKNFWEPGGNTIRRNVVTNSGVADLALSSLSAGNNCFSDNTISLTVPPFLQFTHACGSLLSHAGGGDLSAAYYLIDHYMRAQENHFQARSWKTYPNPTALQPSMPDPTGDIQGIFANTGEYTLNMTVSSTSVHTGLALGGLGLGTPFSEIILGFYIYLLPIALYAVWFGICTWDIIRRTDLKTGTRVGWLAIVYLIPVLGPLAYLLFGKSEIQRSTRLVLALGAPLAYVALAALLLFLVP